MYLLVSRLAGLPAHPLLVHAAVILVPLAAIGFASTCWRSDWRRWFAIPVAALAIAGAAFAILAAQSGGPLEHAVREAAVQAGASRPTFGEHPEQGDTAEFWSIIMAVTIVAALLTDRFGHRLRLPAWSGTAAYATALVPALIALVTIVIAGHSGAELVWEKVGSYAVGA